MVIRGLGRSAGYGVFGGAVGWLSGVCGGLRGAGGSG